MNGHDYRTAALMVLAIRVIVGALVLGAVAWGNSIRCERLTAAYPQYNFRIHKGICQVEVTNGFWISTYDDALIFPTAEPVMPLERVQGDT